MIEISEVGVQLSEWQAWLHLLSDSMHAGVGKWLHTPPSHPSLDEPQRFRWQMLTNLTNYNKLPTVLVGFTEGSACVETFVEFSRDNQGNVNYILNEWVRYHFAIWFVIQSNHNQCASHSKRGKKTRQTQKEVGRQHQGMDRPGVH